MIRTSLFALLICCASAVPASSESKDGWNRHTIDDSSQGADGVRLGDLNADGLLDVVTGWEEGGLVRVYLNPGTGKVRESWPQITVGVAPSVEDAVFADLDGDGFLDVISSTEGRERTVYVHRASTPETILNPDSWTTRPIPITQAHKQWMFCVPMDIDQRNGLDLILGSKNENAGIGWLASPQDPQSLDKWTWNPLYEGGWIMSIDAIDMDGDGDSDILFSDRKGPSRGCHWLERPIDVEQEWNLHRVGGGDREVMFLARGDLDGDGLEDLVVSAKDAPMLWLRRVDGSGLKWDAHDVPYPADAGSGKGIALADVDLDGVQDVVLTCEHARGKVGVQWLKRAGKDLRSEVTPFSISGVEGTKFDRIEMLDLDGDGDLDLLTCEEAEALGVIWYENPSRP